MPDSLATREFLKTASAPRIPTKTTLPSADGFADDVGDVSDAEEDVELDVDDVDEDEEDIFCGEPNEVEEEMDMSLDTVALPSRPRKPKIAAKVAAKAKAKGKAKATGKAKAGAEDLVVVPAGVTLADCEKERARNGFRLMYSGRCIAVQSHWGSGLENVSMKCYMHHKCRVAVGILRLTDTDLLARWVLAGAGPLCKDSKAHTEIPLPALSSSSSSA